MKHNNKNDDTRMLVDHTKYYGERDLSIPINMKTGMVFLKLHEDIECCNGINEVLELYNIYNLSQCRVRPIEWSEEEFNYFVSKKTVIMETIGRFMNSIGDDNIFDIFDTVYDFYLGDFFELFELHKVYKRVSIETFERIIGSKKSLLFIVLHMKGTVNKYDKSIAEHMRKNVAESAEIVLKSRLQMVTEDDMGVLFLPSSLSQEDYGKIIKEYICSADCNPNYLKLIANSQDEKSIMINPKTRLEAERRYVEWMKKNVDFDKGFSLGVEVEFGEFEKEAQVEITEGISKYLYSKKWIEENLDYPTLLQNFVTLFEFSDTSYRLMAPSYKHEMGAIERHIGIRGKNDYLHGLAFNQKDIATSIQMCVYRELLKKYGIRIEEVYSWFFTKYLVDEFDVKGFSFHSPNPNASFREATRDLLAEIDGVLKQFNIYVETGELDRGLLAVTRHSPGFSEIKSMNHNKYAYSSSDELDRIVQYLFSDQSHLGYTNKTQDTYNTLAKVITVEDIQLSDYEDYQKPSIEWLIDKGAIYQADDGFLRLSEWRAPIYLDLYSKEVLCPSYLQGFEYINELISTGQLTIENTLFSRVESDYFDYMLNNHKFYNGKAIRNRYLHGSNSLSEEQQRKDYYDVLKIIAMIIIKINQEFCLRDSGLK